MSMNINRMNNTNPANYRAAAELKKTVSSESIPNEAIKQTENPIVETDTFERSTEQEPTNLTYKPFKQKLTSDEVKAIKEEQETAQMNLIRLFIRDMIRFQEMLTSSAEKSQKEDANTEQSVFGSDLSADALQASRDLLTNIFGSVEKAYPPIATTPEAAQQAVAEGGDYSVGAVSDRIMKMATSLAGDDPEKLKQMRDAVEQGFERAGAYFHGATNQNLPQISRDTYDEVMKRFDALMEKPKSEKNDEML